nr:Ycf1 protein [Sauvagesia rhodoleuca]
MILKSFILGNLVSLCMKIINSVLMVGLYYGFLTTFSMGPSYLFLLRARVREEGTEKKVSATTGFITGQLVMFISIYYAPLHLALGRPHTITVLALPYLLFHFFWNNHKHFFDYGSTTRNSMRNLSIQCVFLNNLIFQLFNHFILPSSMLVRLVNIYMFRCNNKMLFVTSSFVGWLIGHILFMKWVGLILVWIQQNHSIKSNVLIRSNKYLVSELINFMARIFSILLFITCVYSLGRMPSPILTKKLKETSETEEREESEEETDVEIEKTSETKEIDYKNKQFFEILHSLEGNQENLSLQKKKKKKDPFWFEKPLVTSLFDYKRWNRPFRYIKNDQFGNVVRQEMAQYFFYTCQSDGKERISFTYTQSLTTFLEMIQRKMSLFTTKELSFDELYNHWNANNEKKRKNLTKEFRTRVETLDPKLLVPNTLKKKTRLCNDETKKEYLPKTYDPLLNGSRRGRMKFRFSSSIINETSIKNYIERIWINKIHFILLIINYPEFESKKDPFNVNKKLFSTEIGYFLNLITEFAGKSASSLKINLLSLFPDYKEEKLYSEDRIQFLKFLFEAVIIYPNNKTIIKKATEIKEISKQVSRSSYKLLDEWEQQEKENEENVIEDHEIRSRKAKRVVIFTDNQQNNDANNISTDKTNSDQIDEVSLIRYSQQSDFHRDIIKGSIRAQRRKIAIFELFQANVHSPFFFDRIDKSILFSFEISELMKIIFLNSICKNTELSILNYIEKTKKESEKREEDKREEKVRIEIAEAWDSIIFAQVIRGSLLVTQSILRKYIILPSLIIAKNIIRILFFQFPEWFEDLRDWNREMHVKCTYNGVQLSEREFPQNWLTDGIQIKILFPFRLKPWHRSKISHIHKDRMKKKDEVCFLTVFGMEVELPFGSPRKRLSLLNPILTKLKKKTRQLKKNCFLVIKILKERFVLNFSKEIKNQVIKNILFIKKIINKISNLKRNPILLFGFREVYGLNETKKDSMINNHMIFHLSTQFQSMGWTKFSLTEKKIKDLTDTTNTILNQIENITKERTKRFLTSEIKINPNKISEHANRLKLKSSKNFSNILKRKNTQLVHKSHFFFFLRILIERIYIDIFLGIINIPRINAQFFLESTRKIITKYIYYDEENHKKIDKRKEKRNEHAIHFISIIKKSLINNNNAFTKNSQPFCDVSSLSQTYVFYKLSQIQVINFYRLRSVLQNEGTPLSLKNEIKEYFATQGLFHSQLKDKNFGNSIMNQWKNWLKSHYQYKYDLSPIRWSRLIPQKRRHKISQDRMVQNKDKNLHKWIFYEKNQLIHYEKQNDLEADSLANQKENFKKHYRYCLLSYKSINYEEKKDSSIYRLPFQVNNKHKQEIYNTEKSKLLDILKDIPINNYLTEKVIVDINKNLTRKYFDWRILYFCPRNKVNIDSWINIGTKQKKNKNKTSSNTYQIIDKIDKKGLFFFTIHKYEKKVLSANQKPFDWIGMNEEILNHPIFRFELWLFQKFVILYNTYKIKPWSIPIKLLLLNSNGNETAHENQKINEKRKKNGDPRISISSTKKQSIELANGNQEKKESKGQVYRVSVLTNQEKDIEKTYAGSVMKKRRKKNQSKNNMEAELNFFLKRYLRFQLRWDDSLNQKIINNIKVYCLLLRLPNPREISLSSIQSRELSLDILMTQKNLTFTELMKQGILIIEPVRLSVKNDGQFFMYQIIGIILVHNSKQQINQRYIAKSYVDKKTFTAPDQNRTGHRDKNYDKNHYDLLVLEQIFAPKHRRELRILMLFNSKKRNDIHINTKIFNTNNIKDSGHILKKSNHFDRAKKKLNKLKRFLWPNYRLEDLACMNRYWFDTNNASRFSMVRIHIYPPFKI